MSCRMDQIMSGVGTLLGGRGIADAVLRSSWSLVVPFPHAVNIRMITLHRPPAAGSENLRSC